MRGDARLASCRWLARGRPACGESVVTFVVGPRTALCRVFARRVSAQWGLWGRRPASGRDAAAASVGVLAVVHAAGTGVVSWCLARSSIPLLVVGRSAMGVLGDVGHIVTKPDCGVVCLFTFSTAFSDARSAAGRGAEGGR